MLELKATDHKYYCSESNFYNNCCLCEYETWSEFKEAWFINNNSKIDRGYNLCFRYDVMQHRDPDTDELIDGYEMWLFFILQRKGIYKPVWIKTITENDMDEINSFLKDVWAYHKFQWNEIVEGE
jgi:hypothetical protein